jgi:hypothetical protein
VKNFVRIRINRAVQPELLTVETDHRFVNRELIHRDGRDRLSIGFMNPVVDSDVTPIYSVFLEKFTHLA